MTWIDDLSFAELRIEVIHHRFLVRVLNAVAAMDGFAVAELIIESNGDGIPSIAINCGLMFCNDFYDKEPITAKNIDILEQTREQVIECGCPWRLAELFACRSRRELPINGIGEYEPEIKRLMKEI